MCVARLIYDMNSNKLLLALLDCYPVFHICVCFDSYYLSRIQITCSAKMGAASFKTAIISECILVRCDVFQWQRCDWTIMTWANVKRWGGAAHQAHQIRFSFWNHKWKRRRIWSKGSVENCTVCPIQQLHWSHYLSRSHLSTPSIALLSVKVQW